MDCTCKWLAWNDGVLFPSLADGVACVDGQCMLHISVTQSPIELRAEELWKSAHGLVLQYPNEADLPLRGVIRAMSRAAPVAFPISSAIWIEWYQHKDSRPPGIPLCPHHLLLAFLNAIVIAVVIYSSHS